MGVKHKVRAANLVASEGQAGGGSFRGLSFSCLPCSLKNGNNHRLLKQGRPAPTLNAGWIKKRLMA